MIFDFSYMNIEVENTDEWYRGRSEWTTTDLRERMFNSQKQVHEIEGYLGNVLENHDQPRVLSKLISNAAYRTETAAKTLATMYYFLPGVPADVIAYQRRLDGRLLTVVINLSEKPNRVSLTQPGEVLCKAGAVTQHGHRFQLPPYTAIVLGVK